MEIAELRFLTILRSRQPRLGSFLLLVVVLLSLGLAGCASRSDRAPVVDLNKGGESTTQASSKPSSPSHSTKASPDGTYVVKRGDTLYSIAKSNDMKVASLSKLNGIVDPGELKVGQVLKVTTAAESSSSSDEKPSSSSDSSTQSSSADESSAKESTVATDAPVGSTKPAQAADADTIDWGWPLRGKIIQSFNSSTKGIDIEADEGSPVIAAADGKVMYAGNGVRGLGNLILLGHSDGFISAYAHNKELLVETGKTIKKGERIATVGDTDTSSPRLHFEIRRKGTPVDPISYLPRS